MEATEKEGLGGGGGLDLCKEISALGASLHKAQQKCLGCNSRDYTLYYQAPNYVVCLHPQAQDQFVSGFSLSLLVVVFKSLLMRG